MKKYTLFFSIIIFISFHSIAQQTLHFSGDITQNTHWNYDTVFLNSNLQIYNNTTLSIAPGTKVIATGYYKIAVKGRLLAIGSPHNFIQFSVKDTTYFSDTTIQRGGWGGLNFDNISPSNDSSILHYCKISYSKTYNNPLIGSRGGAIYINRVSKLLINACEITHNLATQYGGAILIDSSANPLITNNLIKENIANNGGGIASLEGSAPLIENNIIIHNTVQANGGAIYVSSNFSPFAPTINRNMIANNHNPGGAIYESSLNTIIINNIIVNNSFHGIFNGHQLSSSIYANNTICYNTGLGVFSISGSLKITNCIIRNNIKMPPYPYDNISYILGGFPDITYNNIGGRVAQFRPTNIDTPTLFVRPSREVGLTVFGYEADWRLHHNSPEINAGTLTNLSSIIGAKDAYGTNRVIGNQIDIGAAEYNPIASIGLAESDNHLKIFPNPFNQQVWIESIQNDKNLYCRLYNMKGEFILEQKITHTPFLLEMDRLHIGTYFLVIYDSLGTKIQTAKLIKAND